jgi:flagellar biosynthetic protein FliR
VEIPPGTLEAFGLFLVRSSALVLSAPVLGTTTGFSGYKVALVFCVAFLLYGVHGAPLAEVPLPIEFACLVLREVLIGLALSFSLHAVMLALRVGGELVGHEMGFNMAGISDPVTGLQTPLVTHLYETMFFLGLLAVNGHHWILLALERSFGQAPVGSMALGAGIVPFLTTLFGEMFRAGLTLAAPVLVLLVLVSMLIGLLARAVPQVNVIELGFTLRISVGLIAMFLLAPLLSPALEGLFTSLMDALESAPGMARS